MTTFFEKKSFYIHHSNFVAVAMLVLKRLHNLCILWVTKSGNIVLVKPFAEIKSFVTKKFQSMERYFFQIIDRHIHLFINFVAILGYCVSEELLFITKGVIEIIF